MKRIPDTGIVGLVALREAATTEFNQLINLVRAALMQRYQDAKAPSAYVYVDIEAIYADRVIVNRDGRYWQLAYSIDDKNAVVLKEPVEVIERFDPVTALREAAERGDWFVEAAKDGKTWDVIVIRAGLSQNGVYYSDAVLREAVAAFEGAKVYAKSNDDHLKGSRPDIAQLAGWISGVKFVEGAKADTGYLAARLNLSGAAALRETIVDAWQRGKKDLVGLSIDAIGKAAAATGQRLREGVKRVAQSISKVLSVDLIVDPSAGGALVRLVEAADSKEQDAMKDLMLAAIKAKFPQLDVAGLDGQALLDRYAEAIKTDPKGDRQDGPQMTREEFQAELRMVEARASMRARIGATTLPQPSKDALIARFEKLARFTEADVDTEIKAERAHVVRLLEAVGADAGKVKLEGGDIQVEDRSVKIAGMMDAFFDPEHKDHRSAQSFKECYIEITGDKRVTGRWEHVNKSRLAESIGAMGNFRESLDSTSFSSALGTSITRRMIAAYRANKRYAGWREICSVVPLQDFRTQTRVNIGGYGDLPTVAQGAAYLGLTSPTDAAATYTPTKKGGTEDVTLEMIKNDDVGTIRRIPMLLQNAAHRTLAKFVFDFIRSNPTIYDSVAFFHSAHGNLGSTAFSATEYGVVRTAMLKQAERDSSDRMGVGPIGILCPPDLESAVWTAFQRSTNNDKDFIQTLNPKIIPVWYWTDATDWAAFADPNELPGIEVGFLDGQEEPELFVQDNPTVGSMFSNDKLTYKIRHIYGGAVVPDGYKAFYKEVVAG